MADSRPTRRPGYQNSLQGLDPNRDYARFALPRPDDETRAYGPLSNLEQDRRNDDYQDELNQHLRRPPTAPNQRAAFPDINLINTLYDRLVAAERAGVTSGLYGDFNVDGAREILTGELYKAQQDYLDRVTPGRNIVQRILRSFSGGQ